TESGLLETLSDSQRTHAFCVVQGDPGSGKSHLIRWLAVHWPKRQDDLVLLLQRADGSLQGALDQLRAAMTLRWPASAQARKWARPTRSMWKASPWAGPRLRKMSQPSSRSWRARIQTT